MISPFDRLRIKIFADGASVEEMVEMASKKYIKGFTTNPTLMKKAGVTNYKEFAKKVLEAVPQKPISFEVISDDPITMIKEGIEIASWGENVFVKIPVTNTKRELSNKVISTLAREGVKINVTAIMTHEQVMQVIEALNPQIPSFISVFAGRIADTGRDPLPIMSDILQTISPNEKTELIWASPRELYNLIQADQIGCHIITATNDIIAKIGLIGKNLDEYSLETVKMFYNDAITSDIKF
jgi:transaldolase